MTEHHHPHHKTVIQVLDIIARENKRTLSKIKKLFSVQQDIKTANRFWEIMLKTYPKQEFVEVWRCHGSGKFGMDMAATDDQYQAFLRGLRQHIKIPQVAEGVT